MVRDAVNKYNSVKSVKRHSRAAIALFVEALAAVAANSAVHCRGVSEEIEREKAFEPRGMSICEGGGIFRRSLSVMVENRPPLAVYRALQ